MTASVPHVSRWRLVFALGAMSALGPLSFDMYLPALPDLASDLLATDAMAQLTLSACLIGLAVGQIVIGPLSDRFGRRKPLMIGLISYAVLCALCALAPTIGALIALRAAQGFAGAAGIVLGRAIVRDVYRGREVARILSILVLISGIAPLVAPLLGGQLLKVVDWRGVFAVLAVIGVGIAVLAFLSVPESFGPELRHTGGFRAMGAGFGRVFREPLFMTCTIALTLSGAAIFTYISSSSFVLQLGYGLTSEQFSFVFAANSAGVATLGYLNASLVRRVHPRIMLMLGSTIAVVGSVACLAGVLLHAGLWPLLIGLFATVASGAFLQPNATALGLSLHARDAGTASAVIGTGPFLLGSAVAPLALIGGSSALAMSTIIAGLMLASSVIVFLFVRPISRRVHEHVVGDVTVPLHTEPLPREVP